MAAVRRALITALVASLLIATVVWSLGLFGSGWRGRDIHLVGGTWVGTERPCQPDDTDCRIVVERALSALEPGVRSEIVSAVRADLPDTYSTLLDGTRRAQMTRGLDSQTALVVELANGQRRVMGFWCYLPHGGAGLVDESVRCETGDVGYWRDGQKPPAGLY